MSVVGVSCALWLPLLALASDLRSAYGPVEVVKRMTSWTERGGGRIEKKSSKLPENCSFPFEIMFVQDTTNHFQDDFDELRKVQLPEMTQWLAQTHPASTFGLVSFRDKPLWTVCEPSVAYCHNLELKLSPSTANLLDVYGRLVSKGDGDDMDNQFGALIATAKDPEVGWSKDEPSVTKLIILITDSPPHFADDGANVYGLQQYSQYKNNTEQQCITEYYPTPFQVKQALQSVNAYLATFVYDYSDQAWDNWDWFNAYIGQTQEFVQNLQDDSSNFWELASKIIAKIEEIECFLSNHKTSSQTNLSSTLPPKIAI